MVYVALWFFEDFFPGCAGCKMTKCLGGFFSYRIQPPKRGGLTSKYMGNGNLRQPNIWFSATELGCVHMCSLNPCDL